MGVQFKQFRILGLIPITAPESAKGKLDTTFLDEELRIRCPPALRALSRQWRVHDLQTEQAALAPATVCPATVCRPGCIAAATGTPPALLGRESPFRARHDWLWCLWVGGGRFAEEWASVLSQPGGQGQSFYPPPSRPQGQALSGCQLNTCTLDCCRGGA